jgi:hypothetical protein
MRGTCPNQGDFVRPLLLSLGRATNLTPGVGVDSKVLIPEVLREAGVDPDNIPAAWLGNGRSNGIRRAVQFCYLALKRGLYTIAKPDPLTDAGDKRGWWALTQAGVDAATTLLASHQPEPSMGVFREPIFRVLGEATGYNPDNPVPAKALIPLILREAGYDPDNLPTHWDLKGTTGVYRKITFAYYALYQRRKTPLVLPAQGGLWGFTAAGAAHVRKLVGKPVSAPAAAPVDAPNATAKWYEEQLPLGLMDRLERVVARKMRVSSVTQQVQDHVQNFFVRQIRRDALAKHLKADGKVQWSKITTYAVRSAATDIRDDAHNPVCRTIYGSKTNAEVRASVKDGGSHFDIQHRDRDTDGNLIPEGTTESTFELMHDYNVLEERLYDLIRNRYRNGDRMADVLKMRIADATPAEIAKAQGVSEHRGASLSARARACAAEVWEELLSEVG